MNPGRRSEEQEVDSAQAGPCSTERLLKKRRYVQTSRKNRKNHWISASTIWTIGIVIRACADSISSNGWNVFTKLDTTHSEGKCVNRRNSITASRRPGMGVAFPRNAKAKSMPSQPKLSTAARAGVLRLMSRRSIDLRILTPDQVRAKMRNPSNAPSKSPRRADEQEVDSAQAGGIRLGSCTK